MEREQARRDQRGIGGHVGLVKPSGENHCVEMSDSPDTASSEARWSTASLTLIKTTLVQLKLMYLNHQHSDEEEQ